MNETPRLIALTGLKQSGKSTIAEFLCKNYEYTCVKFAHPLKAMLRAIGLTDAEIEGSLKEIPSRILCGITPRHAMQTLGTEWGRELIHPKIWTNLWHIEVMRILMLTLKNRVVCDDLRYVNEAKRVKSSGGMIVKIVRPGIPLTAHSSETELSQIQQDRIITNNRDIPFLLQEVVKCLMLEDSL